MFPLNRWDNCSTERSGSFPRATELRSDRTGMGTQTVWPPSLCSQCPHYVELTQSTSPTSTKPALTGHLPPTIALHPPVCIRMHVFIFLREWFNTTFRCNCQFIRNKEDRKTCRRILRVSNQLNPGCSKLFRRNNAGFSMNRWQKDSNWFLTCRLRDSKDL